MATPPVPPIPFMTAALLPPAAEPWRVEVQARLALLMLIEETSQRREKENLQAYDYQREEASQDKEFGGLPSVTERLGVLYEAARNETNIQGLVKLARIPVNNWVLNAPNYARLNKSKPFPALNSELAAYLETIAL